ncbi:MAG: hypothetical protein WBO44_03030 [Saprospiraceae bacterium]
MKKLFLQSLIVATCADIVTAIVSITIYYSNHSPIDWGLIRFALFMGYWQEIIIIVPVLFLSKIYLSKISKIYYYVIFSIIYFSLYLTFYPLVVPTDVYFLILEIAFIIIFDFILFNITVKNLNSNKNTS